MHIGCAMISRPTRFPHASQVNFRLPVSIYCGPAGERRNCHTSDISIGGFFAIDAQRVEPGDPVHVEFGPKKGDALHLDGLAVRANTQGAGLAFQGNSPATLEVLQALRQPDWDGGNLLDGVVKIAPPGTAKTISQAGCS